MKEWSLSGTALGIMSSLYFLLYAAVQVPSGILTDFVGPKKLIVVSAASMVVGSLLSYVAPTFAILCIGRALIGAGAGLTFVPLAKILRYWFRKREFATMMGLNGSVGNVGAIIASAPLVGFISLVGWRNVFLYMSILTLPLIVMNIEFVEDSPEKGGFPPIEPHEVNSTEKINIKTTIAQGVSIWLKDPTFALLAVIMAIDYGTLMGVEGLWAGSFLSNVYKMDVPSVGNWLLIIPVGMVIGHVLAGYLSDRVFGGKRRIPIILGTVLYATNWVLLLVVAASQQHPQLLMLLLFTLGITFSIAHVPILGLVADLSPRHLYGTVFGIHNMSPFIGSTIFQGIMGRILDTSGPVIESGIKVFPLRGYLWAFAFCTVAALFAALLTTFIKKPTSSGKVE
jgi:sugar phosphate permease